MVLKSLQVFYLRNYECFLEQSQKVQQKFNFSSSTLTHKTCFESVCRNVNEVTVYAESGRK